MTTEEVTNMIKSRAKENGTISSPPVNTPVVDAKPVTPVVDAKPVTPVVDAKPVATKPLTGGRSKSRKKRRKKRTKKKTRKHL